MTVIYNKIPQIMDLIYQEVVDIIRTEPMLMKNDVTDAMNKPHSGRIYRRGTVDHQASAPGEAPAIDFGGLVNSLQVTREHKFKSTLSSNQPQALALELGRPEAGLAPRPYMIPAAEKSLKRVRTRLAEMKRKVENVRR